MSHENPTPLRIGATGTLNGWRVRVAGRLVLGVDVEGETYTWNEFHLVDNSGNSATLVCEEGEGGPEWKIFRDFTPTQPMTARAAAAIRVGATVNLDGSPLRVTLADQSEVLFIEGQAPEGVEVGDVAHYFNADAGSRMLVASWSGDEIEFYEGLDAPAESVAIAFGFPSGTRSGAKPATASFTNQDEGNDASALRGESGPARTGSSSLFTKIALVLLGGAGLLGAYSCFFAGGGNPARGTAAPAAKIAAPALRLATGARGTIDGRDYVVVSQNVVQIARTAGRHDQREYQLREEPGSPALLINGLSGGAREWHLLRAIPVPAGLTPPLAAAKKKGQPVPIGDRTASVTDLFLAKTPAVEPATAANVQYGFVARDSEHWLLARWTEQEIQFFGGLAAAEADVLKAFGPSPAGGK